MQKHLSPGNALSSARDRSPQGPIEGGSIIELTKKRSGDRSWWAELDWLVAKGYKSFLNGFDARLAESTPCSRCGHHRMEYRGFSIAGIVNRSYALCDMCEHWFEF